MKTCQINKTIESDTIKTQKLIHILGITLLPLLGFIVAISFFEPSEVGLMEIGILITMWIVSGTGITVGFHRYFAHRTFQTNTFIRVILIIFGSMAAQGPLINWVALHRRHHEYSDKPGDPHSPHIYKDRTLQWLSGLWHAHVGWMFNYETPNPAYYAPELLKDRTILKISRFYLIWLFMGLFFPTVLGGLLKGTWIGALKGFLWGGLVRLFLTENIIWSINSITHFHGCRSFDTSDRSKNNAWLAIPTLGESWHNNHHAFSNSAIFGLEWWQLDFGGCIIRGLEKLNLAWDIKVPTKQMIEMKKNNS